MGDDFSNTNFRPMETKKLPVYEKTYFPKKPNDQYVREYFYSKAQFRGIKKHFTGDTIERSVEITNFLVKKQLNIVTKKLRDKRIASESERKSVKEQWQDLVEKEESLRENFIRFNQFVKENQEKKERAANKIVAEKQLKEEREKKKNELLHKCEEIANIKKGMDKNIAKYRIYEQFLMQVIENEPAMNVINDLLKRYEALLDARNELNEIQTRNLKKLETAKSNLMKLIEEKNFIILGLNNQIANLQARYENANIKALESEALVMEIKNNAVKQMEEINAVKNSIWNTYVHMAMSKKHRIKIKKENLEDQMLYINRTLTELVKVNKQILSDKKLNLTGNSHKKY